MDLQQIGIAVASSFAATVAFAVLFQAPRKVLVQAGVIGAMGWLLFCVLRDAGGFTSFYANFYASMLVSLLSELAARIFLQPSTVFNVPAILPLVPGLGIYRGISLIIGNDFSNGAQVLLQAVIDAGAIALGLMMVVGLFRALKVYQERSKA